MALSRTALTLMFRGIKTFGTYNPDDVIPFIEEDLTGDEVKTLEAFLSWVHETEPEDPEAEHDRMFGHGNFNEVFARWERER